MREAGEVFAAWWELFTGLLVLLLLAVAGVAACFVGSVGHWWRRR